MCREEVRRFLDPDLSWDSAHRLVELCDRFLGLKEVDYAEAFLGLPGHMDQETLEGGSDWDSMRALPFVSLRTTSSYFS